MAMPPNQDRWNALWWDKWFFANKKDSQKEAAFQGYLATQGLHPFALTPEQLDVAWANFQGYIAASEASI